MEGTAESDWEEDWAYNAVWREATPCDTQSGYKLHVYAETRADVEQILSLTKELAGTLGVGLKGAGAAFFREASMGQRNKGVTFYLPRRATAQRDAERFVAALASYGKDGVIPGDQPLGNGVHWRFEFRTDPGRDLSTREAQRMYLAAADADKFPRPASVKTLVPPIEIRIRGRNSQSLGTMPLQLLQQHQAAIVDALGAGVAPQNKFAGALRLVNQSWLREAQAMQKPDVAVAFYLHRLGFSVEARVNAADNSPAGVKITGLSKNYLLNQAVLEALAPVALPTGFLVSSSTGYENWRINMQGAPGVERISSKGAVLVSGSVRENAVKARLGFSRERPFQREHVNMSQPNPVPERAVPRERENTGVAPNRYAGGRYERIRHRNDHDRGMGR